MPERDLTLAEKQVRFVMAARDILGLVRSRLFIDFRFLDAAIGRLNIQNDDLVRTTSTEGSTLYYNARYIVKTFNDEPNDLNRAVMHSVLHCIFRHPFVSDKINQPMWNLACDIAVETIITEMDSELLKCKGEQYQEETIANLKSTLKSMTAEGIYKYLNESALDEGSIKKMQEAFVRDNHLLW